MIIEEQERVLKNDKKNMLVSASAGSGKTYIMIKYLSKLICEDRIPVKDFLVLTFTKAAASEMKERLEKRLKEYGNDPYVIQQIDALSTSNISTIHAFCEKSLKKYANLINLNDNFSVVDENLSQKIRQNAVDLALKEFQKQHYQDYMLLMSSYKNDRNKIKNIIFEIEKLANSVADKETFLTKIVDQSQSCFELALDFLFETYLKTLNDFLDEIEKLHVDDFLFALKTSLKDVLNSKNLFEIDSFLNSFSFPYLPKRKEVGDEIVDKLNFIKKSINKIFEKIKALNLSDEDNVEFQKNGLQEKRLLKLFKIYEKNENNLKKSLNCLDFYDLEKNMKILSEKENLFSGIKYVFVDEYQDTNKIQEKIIKNIAKNSNFVAVGDVKQGIYGFRLASSEIFLKDLNNFEKAENSTVNFLQSNFRSDQKVLDFINKVFSKCMTKAETGVDYQKEAMLLGRSEFVDDGQKAVNIDIVSPQIAKEKSLPKIYDVKEAESVVDNKKQKLLLDIKRQIQECLSSEISVDGQLRKVRYSDIAILSRKRDGFYNQLENFLQENEIPLISNSKLSLMQNPYMKVLLNYLKIAECFDDDVALLSVLLSPLAKFDINDLMEEKLSCQSSLCEIVAEDKNSKFSKFNENLQEFRLNLQIFGINSAFLTLFNKTNFIASLNLLPNHQQLSVLLDKFLTEINSSGYDFDLPSLISYFESVDITVTGEPNLAEDSVLLTTIHNSKGLEYPIVFLIGCDQSLKKVMPKGDVEINETFALAVKYFDKESNKECNTVKMQAIKESQREKEFAEELMIFYVALTRAKNRLYLFGEEKIFDKSRLQDCDCYFDLIFYALDKELQAFEQDKFFENDTLKISLIEDIEQLDFKEKQNFENVTPDENFAKRLDCYINFKYPIEKNQNYTLKESVTSLSRKNQEESLEKYSTDSISFGSNMIDIGNAYHLALKLIDFEKVKNFESLETEIENKKIDCSLIDKQILLKNVLLLKEITAGAEKIFKEKEFIMKVKLQDIFENSSVQDKILVQGIVDLFAIKDNEIVLVDYKYSNSNNQQYLIEKYKNQIKSYKIALEKALKMPIKASFLLSLKQNQLIKID